MVQGLRRVGIAVGSFVAASLVMWLVGFGGDSLVSVGAFPFSAFGYGSALTGLATFVLGYLIYRDIIRREVAGDDLSPGG